VAGWFLNETHRSLYGSINEGLQKSHPTASEGSGIPQAHSRTKTVRRKGNRNWINLHSTFCYV